MGLLALDRSTSWFEFLPSRWSMRRTRPFHWTAAANGADLRGDGADARVHVRQVRSLSMLISQQWAKCAYSSGNKTRSFMKLRTYPREKAAPHANFRDVGSVSTAVKCPLNLQRTGGSRSER